MELCTTAHIHAGLAIFLAFQLAFGRRGSLPALSTIIVCAVLDDLADRFVGAWRPGDTLRNGAATLLWPTLLHLAGSYRRRRAEQAGRRRLLLSQRKLSDAAPGLRVPPRLRVFPGSATYRTHP